MIRLSIFRFQAPLTVSLIALAGCLAPKARPAPESLPPQQVEDASQPAALTGSVESPPDDMPETVVTARDQVLSFIHRLDATSQRVPETTEPETRRQPAQPPSRQAAVEESQPKVTKVPIAPAPAPQKTAANAPTVLENIHIPRPPEVIRVSVRNPAGTLDGGADAIDTISSSGANVPMHHESREDATGHTLERALRQQLESSPGDPTALWRMALYHRAAGERRSPQTDTNTLTEASARLLSSAVATIDAVGEALEDPVRKSDAALEAVDELRHELKAQAGLEVDTVRLCSRVQAYGMFEVLPTGALQPGESNQAIVYFEVYNFASERGDDDRWRTLLSQSLEVLTPEGDIVWTSGGGEASMIEDFCYRRRNDFFVAQRIVLPPMLDAREYVLKVTVQDLLADKRTQAIHPFRMGSPVIIRTP